MRTEEQTANLDRLIRHYESVPSVDGWWWSECAGGVAKKLGITKEINVEALARAIGIDPVETRRLVYGPDVPTTGRISKDRVLAALRGLKETGSFRWETRT